MQIRCLPDLLRVCGFFEFRKRVLTIESHERDSNRKGQDNEYDDPDRGVYIRPELEQNAYRGDLCRD